jgi:hypothetical protein
VGHLVTFQNTHFLRFLVSHLSFAVHFGEFIQGLLRTESVAYFALVIVTALFLNARYFDWRR